MARLEYPDREAEDTFQKYQVAKDSIFLDAIDESVEAGKYRKPVKPNPLNEDPPSIDRIRRDKERRPGRSQREV